MMPLPAEPGLFLFWGFILLPIVMIGGFAFVAKSRSVALVGLSWLIFTGLLGYSGRLSDFSSTPPMIFFLFFPALICVAILAFSRFGKSLAALSLKLLVGYQAFRIVVELLIHEAVTQGVAPPQMTWSGYNYDILTGVTALVLLPFAARLPKWALQLWNAMGLSLLALVVSVALFSMPTQFQQLKPDNIWVAHFPFILLPTVLVTLAMLGHLVLFRKLIQSGTGEEKL